MTRARLFLGHRFGGQVREYIVNAPAGAVQHRTGVPSVVSVGLEEAFGVVDADRPEAVDGGVRHGQLVDRLAVVLLRRDVQIDGILVRIAISGVT